MPAAISEPTPCQRRASDFSLSKQYPDRLLGGNEEEAFVRSGPVRPGLSDVFQGFVQLFLRDGPHFEHDLSEVAMGEACIVLVFLNIQALEHHFG